MVSIYSFVDFSSKGLLQTYRAKFNQLVIEFDACNGNNDQVARKKLQKEIKSQARKLLLEVKKLGSSGSLLAAEIRFFLKTGKRIRNLLEALISDRDGEIFPEPKPARASPVLNNDSLSNLIKIRAGDSVPAPQPMLKPRLPGQDLSDILKLERHTFISPKSSRGKFRR